MSTPSGSEQPINRVRRRDRAVEDETWIRSLLRDAHYAVVATDSEGQPFVNPLLFVYDQQSNSIYFHTGRAGRIFANIAQNPRVCLNVCRMGQLIAEPEACRFDLAYDSVTVFGRALVLDEPQPAANALRLLLAKYFPNLRYGEDFAPITPEQLARAAVYQIEIDAWSGKRNAP
jgi:hypothetical protein